MSSRCVAVIPARSGSKRVPGKNIRLLNGRPLLAYTIELAKRCPSIEETYVSTDSAEIADVAIAFGAKVPSLRPIELAQDQTPDIEWLPHSLRAFNIEDAVITLLRPTSPLRSPQSIERAINFFNSSSFDSVRAIRRVKEHPGKMWRLADSRTFHILPYLQQESDQVPSHSRPTQLLETIYVQDASLEITRASRLLEENSLAGSKVAGFFMPGYEGFDLNEEEDWEFLEWLVTRRPELLPSIGPS